MKRLLSSCQSQLVTKITNIQAVHTEKYCTQYEAYIYLKRHLFKKDSLYGLYNLLLCNCYELPSCKYKLLVTTRNNDIIIYLHKDLLFFCRLIH